MTWFKKKPKPSIATAATAGAGTVAHLSGALREFVYLDEVSVYSLTSSPDSPPPVTMSEEATSTSGEALKTSAEVAAVGLMKSGLGADLSSGRSNGLQIQRQFNIQSQFARLHQLYGTSFALTASMDSAEIKSTDDLSVALRHLQDNRRAALVEDLTRGTLAELRVALRAHSMFDVAVFAKAAGGLIERHPELLQVPNLQEIRQMKDVGDFLNELMENLVPIEGQSSTYRHVTDADGQQWVADIRVLEKAFTGKVTSSPLRVVGVAEQTSFWKDTRRILHSDAEYDVLGRVSRSGLRTDWSPVKLTDAFDRVVPGVGHTLSRALDTLKHLGVDATGADDAPNTLLLAAMKLTEDLASRHEVESPTVAAATLQSLLTISGGLEEQLTLLNRVTDDFYSQFDHLERDADVAASLRQDAWRSAQTLVALPQANPSAVVEPEPLALELEFVAMYW